MIKILFVDDEPNILEGLRRMLRPMRHEWTMNFVGSGADALAVFGDQDVDVVVTDMKMPGMDGAALLNAVMERSPHTIRMVLSGFSEREMILKSVGTAHQFLAKPCDPDTLQSTVKRVSELRTLLTDESLRRLVSRLPSVPSLPLLYTQLIDELNKEDCSTRVVADIVKRDIGMTVKLLQIVNSAFFGLRRQVTDSREAVEFLGLETITSLTLGLGIIKQLENRASGAMLSEIWSQSVAVATMARKIAMLERSDAAADAFTAGLLHALGSVVLAANPQAAANASGETETADVVNCHVGAFLIGLWGLPTEVVRAVAYHDSPSTAVSEGFSALTAVHAAAALRRWFVQGKPEGSVAQIDMDYLAGLGMADRISAWQAECETVQGCSA